MRKPTPEELRTVLPSLRVRRRFFTFKMVSSLVMGPLFIGLALALAVAHRWAMSGVEVVLGAYFCWSAWSAFQERDEVGCLIRALEEGRVNIVGGDDA